MTLDEAIKRYADNAGYERAHGNLQGRLEFKKLVNWLKELKQLRDRQDGTGGRDMKRVDEYITEKEKR